VDDTGRAVGALGQGGLLYARVPQDTGSDSVLWGERSWQRCRLAYAIRYDAVQQVSSGTPHQVCRPGIKEK
ncbi:FimD/PapC C-terminal domain-containing protein, partial [Klebsiella pneumoniae]|uniref:FimD/PapC C-terminal domain-containing protein n=1 Tax=Klebsiella pneumoniae TaxID=573 RepID=UPI002DB5D165